MKVFENYLKNLQSIFGTPYICTSSGRDISISQGAEYTWVKYT